MLFGYTDLVGSIRRNPKPNEVTMKKSSRTTSAKRTPSGLGLGRLGLLVVMGLWLTLDVQIDAVHKTLSLHLTIRQQWRITPGR